MKLKPTITAAGLIEYCSAWDVTQRRQEARGWCSHGLRKMIFGRNGSVFLLQQEVVWQAGSAQRLLGFGRPVCVCVMVTSGSHLCSTYRGAHMYSCYNYSFYCDSSSSFLYQKVQTQSQPGDKASAVKCEAALPGWEFLLKYVVS